MLYSPVHSARENKHKKRGKEMSEKSYREEALALLKSGNVDRFNALREVRKDEVLDLSWVNLSKLDLVGTDLREVNFTGSDLTGSNLSETNLSGTNFWMANLREVNFTGSDFTGSKLSSVNFSRAILTRAKGLDTRSNEEWATIWNLHQAIGLPRGLFADVRSVQQMSKKKWWVFPFFFRN